MRKPLMFHKTMTLLRRALRGPQGRSQRRHFRSRIMMIVAAGTLLITGVASSAAWAVSEYLGGTLNTVPRAVLTITPTAATAAVSWDAIPAGTLGTPSYTVQRSSSPDGSGAITVASGLSTTSTVDTLPDASPASTQASFLLGGVEGSITSQPYALGKNGVPYSWGATANSRLDGSSTAVPQLVPGLAPLLSQGVRVQHLVAGPFHACLISTDSQLYCWGLNANGELGNGTTTKSSAPVMPGASGALAGKKILQVSLGWKTTCAVADDNKAYCWGMNDQGQVGNNTTTDALAPVAVNTSGVLNGRKIVQVAVGEDHACALDSTGAVFCWGGSNAGDKSQLGTNTSTTTSLVPVAVDTSGVLAGKTIARISAGKFHTCALSTEPAVYCWGQNTDGRLGDGTTTSRNYPVAVSTSGVLAGKTVSQLSAGGTANCVLTTEPRVYCWGGNVDGEIGDGTTTNALVPVAVSTSGVLNGVSPVSLSTQEFHACVQSADGGMYCWGSNHWGQLGNNSAMGSTSNYSTVPVTVVQPSQTLCPVGAVALSQTTCSLAQGANYYYRVSYTMGNTGVTQASVWTKATMSTRAAAALTASASGGVTSLSWTAPAETGLNTPWYSLERSPNADGSGSSTITTGTSPSYTDLPPSPPLTTPRFTSLGTGTSPCGITAAGTAYCWGSAPLGDGTNNSSSTPVAVSLTGALQGKRVLQISRGPVGGCLVASDSRVYCWGSGANGALGNGSTADSLVPIPVDTSGVLNGKNITQVSTGNGRSCVIDDGSTGSGYNGDYRNIQKGGGFVYCWGSGWLGNGSSGGSTVPVQATLDIGNTGGASSVSVGNANTTCVTAMSGSAWCWSPNAYGQLGNGTIAPGSAEPGYGSVSSPVTRTGGSMVPVRANDPANGSSSTGYQFTQIAVGLTHVCALDKVSSGVFCWGSNISGQAGAASSGTNVVLTPTAVDKSNMPAGSKVTQISSSDYRSCAVADRVYCWGSGASMVFAIPTAIPSDISGLSGASAVATAASNGSTAYLLSSDGRTLSFSVSSSSSLTALVPPSSRTLFYRVTWYLGLLSRSSGWVGVTLPGS